MHLSSFDKMLAFRNKHLKGRENENLYIVDLGSQDINGTYKTIFDIPPWKYVGIDMCEGRNVKIVLKDPYAWNEVKSKSVDVLVSGQAFEHIEFFWITMLEIARVLKPGGVSCLIGPSAGFEHRHPVDCWRFYQDGFSALARFGRLEVLYASTQWEEKDYPDGSEIWKDTVLICRKPIVKGLRRFQIDLKRCVQHMALRMSL